MCWRRPEPPPPNTPLQAQGTLPPLPPIPLRRLKVPDQAAGGRGKFIDHGVHAFIVPLRDANGCLLPGVEIHDCGYKV